MNIRTNEDGYLLDFDVHDGNLINFKLEEKNGFGELVFQIIEVSGKIVEFMVHGVSGLHFNNYSAKNIIFGAYIWQFDALPNYIKLHWTPKVFNELEYIAKCQKNPARILYVDSTVGTDLIVMGQQIFVKYL